LRSSGPISGSEVVGKVKDRFGDRGLLRGDLLDDEEV
jgi:hypothetical protein